MRTISQQRTTLSRAGDSAVRLGNDRAFAFDDQMKSTPCTDCPHRRTSSARPYAPAADFSENGDGPGRGGLRASRNVHSCTIAARQHEQQMIRRPNRPPSAPRPRALVSVLLALAIGILLPAFASADPRELVEQGKLFYSQQNYEAAQGKFTAASADVPSSSPDAQLLQFNQAATFYQRNDYAKAIELYEKALLTRDPQVEAQGKYNLGNCYFHKALLQSETDPKTAIDQLDKAMTYYRDAMESLANPDHARYNLEKSKLLKKDLIDKAKKQHDEQQKQKGDNKDDKKDQQKQDDQDKQDEQKKDEQKQQQAGNKDQKDQQDQQQQAGEEKQQELSPEDAEKLLNAIREKQQQNEREERVRRPAGYAPVDRDW